MAADRVVEEYNRFSFDVQEEAGKRSHGADGTPLDAPEDILLHVVVFYDVDQITGQVQERRYRFMPETWAVLADKANGGNGLVVAGAADLAAVKAAVPAPDGDGRKGKGKG